VESAARGRLSDGARPFRVALTFDAEHPDRPTRPGVTDSLLDVLDGAGARTTWFLQGRWVEAYAGLARRVAAAGHLIGNHSFYHARMPLLSADGLATDVGAAELVIHQATGVDPRPWFRCPFGTGASEPAILSGLEALGYRSIGWDVDSLDWWPRRTPEALEQEVAARTIAHGDGCVVLMHGWTTNALAALPGLVDRLAETGATFVGLDELDAGSLSSAVDRIDVPDDLDHLVPA
jgi:peptidoglycan/xylan/chitin deacetylase (PgdA/CDA1 family)